MKSNIPGVSIWKLDRNTDERGWLMELFRDDCLEEQHLPAMSYVSLTYPGVVRGPHCHSQQTDNFFFFYGEFELHLWWAGIYESFKVGVNNPVSVIVPPSVIHGYKNICSEPALVINAPNKLYGGMGKHYPVDEVRYENSDQYKIL